MTGLWFLRAKKTTQSRRRLRSFMVEHFRELKIKNNFNLYLNYHHQSHKTLNHREKNFLMFDTFDKS